MSYLKKKPSINIKNGNTDLIYSNRICCINSEPVLVEIIFDVDNKITLSFDIKYDGGQLGAEYTGDGKGRINFRLRNFGNQIGTGLFEPITLGEVNGYPIKIMFFVEKLAKGFPILNLSVYLEEKKDVQ